MTFVLKLDLSNNSSTTTPPRKEDSISSRPSSARATFLANIALDKVVEDDLETEEQDTNEMYFNKPEQLNY